ncbi:MAG: DUF4062 domain-containing protein [Rhizobiaceae bacterium]|nr:DUF4062 domain-containing protein [Rhizobiaceae bacterium]
MQKKYQIFVSSTFRDLAEERQDAIRSILDLGHIPAGMELFPASDTEQLAYIKKVIDECDYYVLIMGGRYGSLDEEGVSFTEREYDYAVETGKVIIAFPHGNLSAIPVGKSDTADRMKGNLEAFRSKVMTGRLVRDWTSREQLESLLVKSLVRAMSDYPAVGWVRANAVASEDILAQINTVRAENEKLRSELIVLHKEKKPLIDSLAKYDENINLKYKYTIYSKYDSTTYTGNFEITWKDIVKYVCPDFMQPRSRAVIGSALSKYLEEIRGASHSANIFDTDINLVANQLIALGLVSSYQANTVKGGVSEFLSLTPLGQQTMLEFSAVRSKDSSTHSS